MLDPCKVERPYSNGRHWWCIMGEGNASLRLEEEILSCVDGKDNGIVLAVILDIFSVVLAASALHTDAIDAVIDNVALSLKSKTKRIRSNAQKPQLSLVRGGKDEAK